MESNTKWKHTQQWLPKRQAHEEGRDGADRCKRDSIWDSLIEWSSIENTGGKEEKEQAIASMPSSRIYRRDERTMVPLRPSGVAAPICSKQQEGRKGEDRAWP